MVSEASQTARVLARSSNDLVSHDGTMLRLRQEAILPRWAWWIVTKWPDPKVEALVASGKTLEEVRCSSPAQPLQVRR
jgi:hypothetical protein